MEKFREFICATMERPANCVRGLHEESGAAVMFVVAMLILYCGMVVASIVLAAFGDYGLLWACLKSAAIIGAARAVLAIVQTKAKV